MEADLAQKLKPIHDQERLAQERPKIIAHRDKVGNNYWERLGDEFKDVVNQDGTINAETLKTLAESDPDVHSAVVNGAQAAEFYATQVYLLDHSLVEYMGDKSITQETPPEIAAQINAHKNLLVIAKDAEQLMKAKAAEKQLDDKGRQFLTRAEFNKLKPEDRGQYWTFNHDDLGLFAAARIAKRTKGYLQAEEEKFSRRAAAKGISLEGVSPPVRPKPAAPAAREDNAAQTRKPVSPSTPIGTRMAPQRGKPGAGAEPGLAGWALKAIRGS